MGGGSENKGGTMCIIMKKIFMKWKGKLKNQYGPYDPFV